MLPRLGEMCGEIFLMNSTHSYDCGETLPNVWKLTHNYCHGALHLESCHTSHFNVRKRNACVGGAFSFHRPSALAQQDLTASRSVLRSRESTTGQMVPRVVAEPLQRDFGALCVWLRPFGSTVSSCRVRTTDRAFVRASSVSADIGDITACLLKHVNLFFFSYWSASWENFCKHTSLVFLLCHVNVREARLIFKILFMFGGSFFPYAKHIKEIKRVTVASVTFTVSAIVTVTIPSVTRIESREIW